MTRDKNHLRHDSDLSIDCLTSKIDLQAQHLANLESDVTDVKCSIAEIRDILTRQDKTKDTASSSFFADMPENFKQPSTTKEVDKYDTVQLKTSGVSETVIQNSTEIKTLVQSEVRTMGNVCIKCSSDVISRFNQSEKLMLVRLSTMSHEHTRVVSRVASLEKSVRALHDVINDLKLPYNSLNDLIIYNKDAEKSTLETESNFSEAKITCRHKPVGVENFATKVKQKNQKQAIENIEKPFSVSGTLSRLLKTGSRAVINQVIAEAEILRNVVIRGYYVCDFFIEDFKNRIGSGESESSNIWHIGRLDRYMKGFCRFSRTRQLKVWLVEGTSCRVMGLPRKGGLKFTFHVNALKRERNNLLHGRTNTRWEFNGDRTINCDGWVCSEGTPLDGVSCDVLANDWLDQYGRLHLQYEIFLSRSS